MFIPTTLIGGIDMVNDTTQVLPVIDDTATLLSPHNQTALIRRLKELSTHEYTTAWMLVESAAIAALLEEGVISAGQVWQLVLPRYGIAPSVSSTPDPANEPGWLIPPLSDRALVWEHLTALCTDQELAPVPAPPGPHDHDDTPEVLALLGQALEFHATSLDFLYKRFGVPASGRDLLGRLGYDLRHDIEQHLAVQWFGGAYAVGASLHALPLPGGAFGTKDQPVYVLKALVEVLKRDIADYEDARLIDQDSTSSRELLGRIQLWWGLVKGYTYDMIGTHQGRIVVAMLVRHPELVEDLKAVLVQGRDLTSPDLPVTPTWGHRTDCLLGQEIAEIPTSELIELLDARLDTERELSDPTRFL
jgi:hypothetical protein